MNYPKVFSATVQTIQGTNTLWNSKVPHLESPIKCAIPPEFQGPGGGYYPEDLFLLAALNCFTATFKVVAQNSKLEFRELTLMGQLTVDLDQDKKPWMATIDVKAHLAGASKPDLAKRIMEKINESCIVLRSIRSHKVFEFSLSE